MLIYHPSIEGTFSVFSSLFFFNAFLLVLPRHLFSFHTSRPTPDNLWLAPHSHHGASLLSTIDSPSLDFLLFHCNTIDISCLDSGDNRFHADLLKPVSSYKHVQTYILPYLSKYRSIYPCTGLLSMYRSIYPCVDLPMHIYRYIRNHNHTSVSEAPDVRYVPSSSAEAFTVARIEQNQVSISLSLSLVAISLRR